MTVTPIRRVTYLFVAILTALAMLTAIQVSNAGSAYGATFEVNLDDDSDDGSCDALSGSDDCTLREAINDANDTTAADIITFDATVFDGAAFTMTGALLTIDEDLTITGPGEDDLEITALAATQVFLVDGADVNISGLTLIGNGATGADGGLLRVDDGDTLTVTDSTLQDGSGANGGAIYAENATLVLDDVNFFDNVATGDGGAVHSVANTVGGSASLSVTGGFFGNPGIPGGSATLNGGAIFSQADNVNATATATINGTAFWDNVATGDGGAIYSATGTGGLGVGADANLSVTAGTFRGNGAVNGAAVVNLADDTTATATASFPNPSSFVSNVASGDGGAVYNLATGDDSTATATFGANTTFSSNDAADGGAVYNEASDDSEATLAFGSGTTFSGNDATGGGGAVYNYASGNSSVATAPFTAVSFSSNDATGNGGAIYNEAAGDPSTATATIVDSTFSSNSGFWGGAIYNETSSTDADTVVDIDGSTFTSNSSPDDGGTIYSWVTTGDATTSDETTATLTVDGSTFDGNSAALEGGVLWTYGDSNADNVNTATFANSTMTDNSAGTDGGGFWFSGDNGAPSDTYVYSVTDSVVSGNSATSDGGGIFASPANEVKVTINRVEVTGNDADTGGGIYADGINLDVNNSTITGNDATTVGGGLFATNNADDADVDLVHVTVAANTTFGDGGGIWADPADAAVNLKSSILAANTAPFGDGVDCFGTVTSDGANVFGSSSGGDCSIVLGSGTGSVGPGTDTAPIDPKLGALAANGGFGKSHLPAVDSPAVDIKAVPCDLAVDQRNFARPFGTACDAGAIERGATGVAPPAASIEVGLVDTATGVWHLRNTAGVETTFFYGNPVDLPVPGDWNGNGTATPGLYRQSDGFFYARNTNTQGIADANCFAGNPNDIPISGDWNNNGTDTLGLYRPENQTFYLFNKVCANAPMGAADITFVFGNPGDEPWSGDVDGDGTTEVGLARDTTGFVYYRNSNTTGVADNSFFWGDPADRVFSTGTPALFRPSNATFYFRNTNTQGNATSQFAFGSGAWLPISGPWGLG